ncbi:GNAT family N-acetyltransferase [Dictyobacter formicarum]|uniref:GNAT family N-acetyltransferase n=1 Tax=Dictyobacter formicarum TaxID=2778368 RepID=UPI0035710191
MVDEAHITTIAMHPAARGQGLGELLLVSLIDISYNIGQSGLRWRFVFRIISPRIYTANMVFVKLVCATVIIAIIRKTL